MLFGFFMQTSICLFHLGIFFIFSFFFFFQAEDGIRDRTVTGVQTCALPICVLNTPPRGLGDKTRAALLASAREHEISVGDALAKADLITTIQRRQQEALVAFRSEERRVGKECGGWGGGGG